MTLVSNDLYDRVFSLILILTDQKTRLTTLLMGFPFYGALGVVDRQVGDVNGLLVGKIRTLCVVLE